jgi:nitrogen fixation NifU-like protein
LDRETAIDTILDHYENPRHPGALEDATFSGEGVNPGCGDVVRLYVHLSADNVIDGVGFEGHGCTISQAAASLLTEMVLGMPLDAALALDESALADALGREVVMSRMPCVSLGLRVLKAAGKDHRNTV